MFMTRCSLSCGGPPVVRPEWSALNMHNRGTSATFCGLPRDQYPVKAARGVPFHSWSWGLI
jgi:hypothetical protein